jgi:hypothetical protein
MLQSIELRLSCSQFSAEATSPRLRVRFGHLRFCIGQWRETVWFNYTDLRPDGMPLQRRPTRNATDCNYSECFNITFRIASYLFRPRRSSPYLNLLNSIVAPSRRRMLCSSHGDSAWSVFCRSMQKNAKQRGRVGFHDRLPHVHRMEMEKMRTLIVLFALLTFALSASFAEARDANRDAIWHIQKQQQRIDQLRAAQTVQPAESWTGYQRPRVGSYAWTTPDALRFYGN